MKSSARARRMARSHRRLHQQAKLSLVSLMDIFTILSPEDIVVQGRSLGSVDDVLSRPGNMIPALSEELAYQAQRAPALTEREEELGRSVVIMGDQDMPYKLLKRIMSTCAASDYRDITLAVNTAVAASVDEPKLAGVGR